MSKNALAQRNRWQDKSGLQGGEAEKGFLRVFAEHFQGSEFVVQAKPKDFKNAYSSVQLSSEIASRIYNPDETWVHGFTPDFAITNTSITSSPQ